MRGLDARVAAVAARQWGIIGRRQLQDCGVGPRRVDRWLAAGRLHHVHPGVYALGHPVLRREARYLAAVLSGGSSAALSHRSAASWWGLFDDRSSRFHVVGPRTRHGVAGVVHHRPRLMPAEELTVHGGIPVTTVPRTLLDLAATEPRRLLDRAIAEAERLRLFDLAAIETAIVRRPRRPGAARLRRAIGDHWPAMTATRSELEQRFLELCRAAGVPEPLTNVAVTAPGGPFTVDHWWPAARLVVELDGLQTHGTRTAFERDRRRDLALRRTGQTVVRLSWTQVTDDARSVADVLHRELTVGAQRE